MGHATLCQVTAVQSADFPEERRSHQRAYQVKKPRAGPQRARQIDN